jgi:hypothetical protein
VETVLVEGHRNGIHHAVRHGRPAPPE